MERLIVLAFVVCFVVSEPIHFKDCTGNAQTMSVDISPCPNQPCVFHLGMTATVKVTFNSPDNSPTLEGEIYGIIAGFRIKWPMPDPDGCHSANITCPVTGGTVYTYVSTLSVPSQAPKIRLIVEWSLIGASGEKQFCFQFPMQIA